MLINAKNVRINIVPKLARRRNIKRKEDYGITIPKLNAGNISGNIMQNTKGGYMKMPRNQD